MEEQVFRQPEFSEDSAWLPTWLQRHFSEGDEKPLNSNCTSKTEWKAFGGLAGSIKLAGEATRGTQLEMVRRQICPLSFSGESFTATEMSESIGNDLALHLSLSSENDFEMSATNSNFRPEEKYQCHVALDNIISVMETNLDTTTYSNHNFHLNPENSNLKDVIVDPGSNNVLLEEKNLTKGVYEHTPCTELYVPGIIQQGDNTNNAIYCDGGDPTFFATAYEILDSKTKLSSAHDTLNNEICATRQTMVGSVQNSLKRQNRKRRSCDKSKGQLRNKISDEELTKIDIDNAIGLTVAAAEALVISDLLETCRLSESIGSCEILEAAIKLKQARQMCGLDNFSYFLSGPMDGVDDSCLDELDDDFMKDAFADVGLCSTDVSESEDAKIITDECLCLSTSKEIGVFVRGSLTPSTLEPDDGSPDDNKDDAILSSSGIDSFSDMNDSRLINRITNNSEQSDCMGKSQTILKHARASNTNDGKNMKPSENGLFDVSENSPNRDMSIIGLREKLSSTTYMKYDKVSSFQSKFPSMEDLVQFSNKLANEAVGIQILSATKHIDNDAVEKGMSCENANEVVNDVQLNVICSPSWLHPTDNKVEEIMRHGISQHSDSLDSQSQVQSKISHTKELENAYNTQVTRSTEFLRPFSSRWFGGWTGLEKERKANKKFEVTMFVQKPFVDETSYLTESMDTARVDATPVQASSSQLLKMPLNNICPISDMHLEDLSSTNKEVSYSLLQNSGRCPNSPVYDPLCSMVPCSIPEEDDLLNKRTDIEIQDPTFYCKLPADASLQVHERSKPSQKENIAELSKQSQQDHFKEPEQVRTCRFGCEPQVRVKRKRVDSLKHYSTLSGVPQRGSIELLYEKKEVGSTRDSIVSHDSIERLNVDCPSANNVIPTDDKKIVNNEDSPPRQSVIQDSSDSLTGVCLSAVGVGGSPNNDIQVVNNFSDLLLEETPCRNLSAFQGQYKYNDIVTGIPGKHKDVESRDKPSDNLGIELNVCLDVEESSPLVLQYRKRKRIRATQIIKSDSEDSKCDKAASHCLNECIAALSDNVKNFEPAKSVFHYSDMHQQDFNEQFSSKHWADNKNVKRVRFSEDIIKHQPAIDSCQQDGSPKLSIRSFQKHRVCRDVSAPTNQFESSFRQHIAEVGKMIGDDCRRNKRENNVQELRLQGLKFLLTGLSIDKKNDLEELIREHGGILLSKLPSLSCTRIRGRQKLEHFGRNYPIILSSQQVRTMKFLYGCAVGSLLLHPSWVTDSIEAKCHLPFDKYLLQSNDSNLKRWAKKNHSDTTVENSTPLFKGIRIMLYGKPAFCSKLMILIKHGGGLVLTTIESLLHGRDCREATSAVIVVENVRTAPRHLRQCASEHRLPVMSGNWVIESLLLGHLLPFQTNVSPRLQSLGKRCHLRSSLTKKPSAGQNVSNPDAASSLRGRKFQSHPKQFQNLV